MLDASIVFTPVQGYLTVDYRFDQADETDIWLNPCDASGKRIATGSGSCGQLRGEDRTLGSITCRVAEELQAYIIIRGGA